MGRDSKLTEAQKQTIYTLRNKAGKRPRIVDLAKRYKVSLALICQLSNGIGVDKKTGSG